LKKNLPSRYQYEKISNLFGNITTKYQIFLKDGEKLYDNKNNEWYLVQHDIYFYDYDKTKKMYVMDYQGFGINEKWFPEDVIFPLGCIQFEGLMCPCPNKVQDYLEICYGYIGEDFIFDSETNLFIKKEI
jgi:phosphorylcholine metabolism protein LicD